MTKLTPQLRKDLEQMERQLIPLLNSIRLQLGKQKIIAPKRGETWHSDSYVYAQSAQVDEK